MIQFLEIIQWQDYFRQVQDFKLCPFTKQALLITVIALGVVNAITLIFKIIIYLFENMLYISDA